MYSNELHKSVIQNSPLGYAYYQIIFSSSGEPEDYEFIEVNSIFRRLTGLNDSNIIGERVKDILPGIVEDVFEWIGFYRDIAVNGQKKEFEYYSASLKKWYKVYAYSPEPGILVTLFSDITESINTQEKLAESEARFREFFDTMTSGVAIFDVHNNGTSGKDYIIKDFNKTSLQIEGKKKNEVIGKSLFDLRPNIEKFGLVNVLQEVWKTGKLAFFPAKIYSDENFCNWYENHVFKLPSGEIVSLYNDVTEQKQVEEKLKRRLKYERLLYSISLLAVGSKSVEGFQNECLRLMGEVLEVSRIYIFEHNHKTDTMDNSFEWVADGVTPEKDKLQGIPASSIPWWTQTLKKNEIINYSNIENIPDETAKEILRMQNIKSVLVVPLFMDNCYHGFIGFDQCEKYREWPIDDLNLLLSISRVITQAIMRTRAEEALRTEREQLLSLFDSISEPIYVADMDTYEILYANKALCDNFNIKPEGDICYKALQGRDTPCDFCTNPIIRNMNYQPYQWEFHNQFIEKDFQIIDRMIQWPDGRNVRFEIAIDITKRKQAEKALFAQKERLRVTLHSIGDGVIATDREGNIIMLNKVAEELTGWSENEAVGKPLINVFNIVNEETRQQCENPVEKVLKTGMIVGLANHTVLIAKDMTERAIADSAAPIMDQAGNVLGVVLVFRDVTEEREKEEEIIYLSYYDRLTGLCNRSFFEEEIKRLDTNRQLPISLIMGDVNGLKITNDVFGHQEGDRILESIARVLKESCRTEDIIARWGGDEFVIFLPNTSDKTAYEICERIRKKCIDMNNEAIHLSISLGYGTKETADEDIMQVMKTAEDFMYKRKLLESKSLRSSIVSSMKKTLCEKSLETEEHADRLSYYCKKIGTAMNLSASEINELELLSMLHDIGKIAINNSILGKEDKLSDEEWEEMKRHPEIGYRIAQSVPELSQIAEYILCHHERWDGKGYPQRLKGTSIPLLSRILAVVDAYDAMINDRPYRKAMSLSKVKQELIDNAGIQFDPEVIRIFLECIPI